MIEPFADDLTPTYCSHCDEEYMHPEGAEKCVICGNSFLDQCDICGDYHEGEIPRSCETGDGE
jgi:hypothetical protein